MIFINDIPSFRDPDSFKLIVDDITNRIVSEVTSAVQQATSTSNYSYGA